MIKNILLKRLIFFITISLIVIGCKRQQKQIRYYPTEKLYYEPIIVNLDLDTIKLNFKQITNKVSELQEEGKRSLIEINDKNCKKVIFPLAYDGSFIKKRNILSITSDSILIDKGYSIKVLKKILKRHYNNNGENYRYPESFKKAGIEVTVDTSLTAKELKKTLIYLTRVFDEVDKATTDKLELRIFFSYFRQIPPPPPYRINLLGAKSDCN